MPSVSFTDAGSILLESSLQGYFGFHYYFRSVRNLNSVNITLVVFNCINRQYLRSGCSYLIVHF